MKIESFAIIVYLIFDIIESFVAFYFFKSFLLLEKERKNFAICIYVARYIISNIGYLLFSGRDFNIILSIILLIILTIPYTAKFKHKLIVIAFYFFIGVLSEVLLSSLLSFSTKMSIYNARNTAAINIIGTVFSKLVLAFFCTTILKFLKRHDHHNISNLYWSAIIITPVGSIIIIYSFFVRYDDSTVDFSIIALIVFVGIINFLVFFVYDKILEEYKVTYDNKLLSNQIVYYRYEFEQIKHSQNTISRVKHDMQKHLLALKIDLEGNKKDKALESIASLIGDLDFSNGPANCGNMSIDAILNYKANSAAEFGVGFECDLQLPRTLNLNTTDITVILCNALDNAIDACKLVDIFNRKIVVSIEYEKFNLYITVSNPYIEKLLYTQCGELMTNKPNRALHGIGLKSIQETVVKYDGITDISTKDNYFVLKIILFNVSEHLDEINEKAPVVPQ